MKFLMQYVCIYMLLLSFLVAQEPNNLSEKITTESIAIAQDITTLITACKKDQKDSDLICTVIKKLLLDTTELAKTIIHKRNQKKERRKLSSIDNFSFDDISAHPLENLITQIMTLIQQELAAHACDLDNN